MLFKEAIEDGRKVGHDEDSSKFKTLARLYVHGCGIERC